MSKIIIALLIAATCTSSCAMLSSQNKASDKIAGNEATDPTWNDTNYQIMMKEQADRMHTNIRH